MTDDGAPLELLDRGYAAIMRHIVETATAPHFTDLAAALAIPIEQARQLAHELVAITPGWMAPDTDLFASFPPFNLQPTQYRVTVDGIGGWYAQCGLEATAIRWLFPGQTVRIEAPCLCCGEAMVVEMHDEEITTTEPAEIVGYTSDVIGGSAESRPFR
ncbi:MAG: organomercurial lyase [Acidimicrobiales bacterium]